MSAQISRHVEEKLPKVRKRLGELVLLHFAVCLVVEADIAWCKGGEVSLAVIEHRSEKMEECRDK